MRLSLQRIEHKVGAATHLYPLELELQPGTVSVLLGATQAGKTTLMRLMAGLDVPTRGRVLVDGQDVTGQPVRQRDRGIVGEATVEFIGQFRVDIGLIGISGIEADGSLRDFDFREVKVAQAIIRCSRQLWLAADHSKFNRPAMVEVGRLAQVDTLFTDQAPPAPFAALLADAGVNSVVADQPGDAR